MDPQPDPKPQDPAIPAPVDRVEHVASVDPGAGALAAIERMRVRIRSVRAARGAIELAMYGAAFALFVLVCAKTGHMSDRAARRLLWASLTFPIIGAAVGLVRRVPALLAAQILDRAYDLKDRLANALEFGAIAPSVRTPMMDAALTDAAEHASTRKLEPRRALAWRWPGETAYAGALVVLLGIVSLVEFRTRVVIPHAGAAGGVHDPLLLTDDDIAAFREFAREMEQHATTDESRDALNRFNQFINQISDEQLDRQDAFRRLQQLQDELEHSTQNDREALRDALREVGNQLQQNETTRQLAQALQQADPRQASQAMQQLAEQVRQNRMNAQQREDLHQALQRAQQRNNDDLQQQIQRAREEVERLLRQQRDRQLSDNERRNLRQRQRELERLQNQQQRRDQQRRQLSRLDQSMSQAMQDLLRDIAQAAQDLDQGAQDLNRMGNEQLSQQQLEEMRQQLEDLRQRMRQQNGQGGQQQRMRLERFAGRARGGVQPGGMQPGGQGQRGRLMLGQGNGGPSIPLPMAGQQGQGQQGQGQQGNDPGGTQAGVGHDEHNRGAASMINGHMRTVSVQGQHGNGPTRSQVIRTAAQDGFTGQGYRDVHAEYWDHAREIVHGGDVPPGYRAYVRRYFQLIRPRDGE